MTALPTPADFQRHSPSAGNSPRGSATPGGGTPSVTPTPRSSRDESAAVPLIDAADHRPQGFAMQVSVSSPSLSFRDGRLSAPHASQQLASTLMGSPLGSVRSASGRLKSSVSADGMGVSADEAPASKAPLAGGGVVAAAPIGSAASPGSSSVVSRSRDSSPPPMPQPTAGTTTASIRNSSRLPAGIRATSSRSSSPSGASAGSKRRLPGVAVTPGFATPDVATSKSISPREDDDSLSGASPTDAATSAAADVADQPLPKDQQREQRGAEQPPPSSTLASEEPVGGTTAKRSVMTSPLILPEAAPQSGQQQSSSVVASGWNRPVSLPAALGMAYTADSGASRLVETSAAETLTPRSDAAAYSVLPTFKSNSNGGSAVFSAPNGDFQAFPRFTHPGTVPVDGQPPNISATLGSPAPASFWGARSPITAPVVSRVPSPGVPRSHDVAAAALAAARAKDGRGGMEAFMTIASGSGVLPVEVAGRFCNGVETSNNSNNFLFGSSFSKVLTCAASVDNLADAAREAPPAPTSGLAEGGSQQQFVMHQLPELSETTTLRFPSYSRHLSGVDRDNSRNQSPYQRQASDPITSIAPPLTLPRLADNRSPSVATSVSRKVWAAPPPLSHEPTASATTFSRVSSVSGAPLRVDGQAPHLAARQALPFGLTNQKSLTLPPTSSNYQLSGTSAVRSSDAAPVARSPLLRGRSTEAGPGRRAAGPVLLQQRSLSPGDGPETSSLTEAVLLHNRSRTATITTINNSMAAADNFNPLPYRPSLPQEVARTLQRSASSTSPARHSASLSSKVTTVSGGAPSGAVRTTTTTFMGTPKVLSATPTPSNSWNDQNAIPQVVNAPPTPPSRGIGNASSSLGELQRDAAVANCRGSAMTPPPAVAAAMVSPVDGPLMFNAQGCASDVDWLKSLAGSYSQAQPSRRLFPEQNNFAHVEGGTTMTTKIYPCGIGNAARGEAASEARVLSNGGGEETATRGDIRQFSNIGHASNPTQDNYPFNVNTSRNVPSGMAMYTSTTTANNAEQQNIQHLVRGGGVWTNAEGQLPVTGSRQHVVSGDFGVVPPVRPASQQHLMQHDGEQSFPRPGEDGRKDQYHRLRQPYVGGAVEVSGSGCQAVVNDFHLQHHNYHDYYGQARSVGKLAESQHGSREVVGPAVASRVGVGGELLTDGERRAMQTLLEAAASRLLISSSGGGGTFGTRREESTIHDSGGGGDLVRSGGGGKQMFGVRQRDAVAGGASLSSLAGGDSYAAGAAVERLSRVPIGGPVLHGGGGGGSEEQLNEQRIAEVRKTSSAATAAAVGRAAAFRAPINGMAAAIASGDRGRQVVATTPTLPPMIMTSNSKGRSFNAQAVRDFSRATELNGTVEANPYPYELSRTLTAEMVTASHSASSHQENSQERPRVPINSIGSSSGRRLDETIGGGRRGGGDVLASRTAESDDVAARAAKGNHHGVDIGSNVSGQASEAATMTDYSVAAESPKVVLGHLLDTAGRRGRPLVAASRGARGSGVSRQSRAVVDKQFLQDSSSDIHSEDEEDDTDNTEGTGARKAKARAASRGAGSNPWRASLGGSSGRRNRSEGMRLSRR